MMNFIVYQQLFCCFFLTGDQYSKDVRKPKTAEDVDGTDRQPVYLCLSNSDQLPAKHETDINYPACLALQQTVR